MLFLSISLSRYCLSSMTTFYAQTQWWPYLKQRRLSQRTQRSAHHGHVACVLELLSSRVQYAGIKIPFLSYDTHTGDTVRHGFVNILREMSAVGIERCTEFVDRLTTSSVEFKEDWSYLLCYLFSYFLTYLVTLSLT